MGDGRGKGADTGGEIFLDVLTNQCEREHSGCYAFRMRKAVDETGYNKDTLEKLLDIMVQRGMILYDAATREVFLLHWGKTNWNRQTATLRAIKADLKEIRSEMIKFKINTQLEKSGFYEGRRK